jgi:hypothetical protein
MMSHHTIRRSTQSGLAETIMPPTSMASVAGFYGNRPMAPIAINTSQHQQYFYGWPSMSPVPSALQSPVVPQSILKQSTNYQKPPTVQESYEGEGKEKRENTWVSFDLHDVCL